LEGLILTLGWMGVYAPLALGAIGSCIGCTRAGQAACGALVDTDSGYGRFIGVAAMPSSQTIYGIVVMMMAMKYPMDVTVAPGICAVGVLSGLALMLSAIGQGGCCASAINASKNKPEVFGISLAPAAIVEGFAVFAFVFALILLGKVGGK
jgi:V/A-type H+/Na+-transporting ATPase subunit K